MAKPKDSKPKLVDSNAHSNIEDALAMGGELALDALLNAVLSDDVLKEIPVFGALVKLLRVGRSLSDAFTARNLLYLAQGKGTLPEDKRQKFAEEINDDPERAKALGEKLLGALLKSDESAKAEMIGRALRARILGHIPAEDFGPLVDSIQAIKLPYLDDYVQIYWLRNQMVPKFEERCQQLISCGLFVRLPANDRGQDRHTTELADYFFKYIVPIEDQALQKSVVRLLDHMHIAQPVDSDQADFEILSREQAAALIMRLSDQEFRVLKLARGEVAFFGVARGRGGLAERRGYQMKDRVWGLRRLPDNRFQKVTKFKPAAQRAATIQRKAREAVEARKRSRREPA